MFRSLLLYRHFIFSSVINEFKSRFARSKLGGLWMIINPLSQVAIYALILSNVLGSRLPGIESKYAYAIYLIAGMLAWTLFTEIITRCVNLFVEQGNLMKKINFPKITLPAIVLGSSFVNYLLLLVSVLFIFITLGHKVSFIFFFIIPLTLLVMILSLSIGLLLGILNVFVRDISQVVPIILQIWFWFTPIVYPETIIPEAYRHFLTLNPIYSITHSYQQVLLYNTEPNMTSSLLTILFISILLMGFSFLLFRKASPEMADVL